MSLLVRAAKDGQLIARVTPASARWRYVGFSAFKLEAGEELYLYEPTHESCIVITEGAVDIVSAPTRWSDVGSRNSVFEDRAPTALYLPPGTRALITAKGSVELGVATGPAKGKFPARLIESTAMKRSIRGVEANTRYVCDILPQTEPAESLLVVEVRTPMGHSSSYPPHKHDTENVPSESSLEETYYHRIDPPQGFVFQRVYTDDLDLDESMAVSNGDVVMVPRGYHPVVVPYGYQSYYLNVMAGPSRTWFFKNDPNHEWIVHSTK